MPVKQPKDLWVSSLNFPTQAPIQLTYHLRSYFSDRASNGFPSPAIISHFEFHRISQFKMFNSAVKLAEMEKESSLSLTALDESIRMLQKRQNYQ